tara:strand:- start:51 stop:1223 length:1173 start_codon:yes stop_codon:yes gene_type:complete
VNADEKKVKTRGKSQDKEFKKIEINISPDLLDLEELKKLKKNLTTANNYAIELDKTLDEKKKIKFRGSAKQIYKSYSKSVFYLYNPDVKAMGTGFLVDDSGLVLSNWHVAEKAINMFVWTLPEGGDKSVKFLFEKQDYYMASVIATNKKQDLALIKVSGLPKTIKPVNLGSDDQVEVGDNVYAIGHPISYPWTFSSGMVSQVRENFEWDYDDTFTHTANVIQMQTPISTGNSGGPLFSSEGKVVGVNTLGETQGQNINFAVAVNQVKQFIKDNPYVAKVNPLNAAMKKEFPKAITQDYNNNGTIDTWYIDTDNNGKVDRALVDDNEDGKVEAVLFDENENEVWESTKVDKDQNGTTDYILFDKDEDGKNDLVATDSDNDGTFDKVEPIKS